MREGTSAAAELNGEHGDADPGLRAGGGSFGVAPQPAVLQVPAERALPAPAPGPHFEPRGVVGARHDSDRQFRAEFFDPGGEAGTWVSPLPPQNAPPSKPGAPAAQDHLRAGASGNAGRRPRPAEHPAQRVHQPRPLPAWAAPQWFADCTLGLSRMAAVGPRNEGAERGLERGPLLMERPFPEARLGPFPRGKVGG